MTIRIRIDDHPCPAVEAPRSHGRSGQKATQDLQAALKRLKERLIYLRAAIRGDIGPRTEKLVEYGITPLRKRRGKAKPAGEGES